MLCLTKGRLFWAFCACVLALQTAFAQATVRINEVMADNLSLVLNDGTTSDWVEFYNPTGSAIDLSGMTLTDDPLDPLKFSFPNGTSIAANGFLLLSCDANRSGSLNAGPTLNSGFSIKGSGATLYLYDTSFVVVDSVTFGPQIADLSIGVVSGVWKLCTPTLKAANVAISTGPATGLKINEFMANPSSGEDWFEIFNPGTQPVALDGLFVTDTLTVKTKHQIAPLTFVGTGLQSYVVFTADSKTNKGPDHVNFSLSSNGEALGLFDSLGTMIDGFTFGPQAIDVSSGRLPDGAATITTFPATASQGRSNYKAVPNLVVNELLSHTDPPIEDAVEFWNKGDADIPIGGWFLSNKETDLKRYRVPDGAVVKAHGYYVIYESSFTNLATTITPFTFNSAHGDQVYLAEADAGGNLTGYRVGEIFETSEHGVSFGRYETSVPGDYKFVAMSSLTFGVDNPTSVQDFERGKGEPNSAPKVGPVVINEVHYHPFSGDTTDNTLDEFIELYNITSDQVLFYDPAHTTNHWRLQNGVSFTFPFPSSIPAFGYALVVSFDPILQSDQAAAFRGRWGVPSNVQLFGPFRGDLNNNGDSIELYKPDPPQEPPHPDAGYVPYYRVDKVNYTDRAPWPTEPDGTGPSLQRKNPLVFGNDPINWASAQPTPGTANSSDLIDSDGDGMTDVWEVAHGFNKNDPSDAAQDADSDGLTNLQEFIAGTDPRNAASRLTVKNFVPAMDSVSSAKITFTAQSDKSYTVQYRNSMEINSTWQKLKNVAPDPTQHDVTVEDTTAVDHSDRYYRIVTPAAN